MNTENESNMLVLEKRKNKFYVLKLSKKNKIKRSTMQPLAMFQLSCPFFFNKCIAIHTCLDTAFSQRAYYYSYNILSLIQLGFRVTIAIEDQGTQ
jgi:hypothetical protein